MKKILVLCILFLCSSWPIFAADSDYVCVHHENIDLNLTRELEKYLDLHFTKDFGHLPVAIVDATHIGFKDSNVYAFYNPKDNYIYFRDKDIASKLNDKYVLNSVIHELTHFYQNNYGNKLPGGSTPNAIAKLMLNFEKEFVDKLDFETAYNNIVKRTEGEINKLTQDINELTNRKKITDEIKKIEQQRSLWKMAQSYAKKYGWENFKKAAIAEGTACLMGTKCSGTFYVTDASFLMNFLLWKRHDTVDDIYLDIFIPITLKVHCDNSNNEEKNFWNNFNGIYTEAGYKKIKIFPQEEWDKALQNVLKNIECKDILKLIERRTEK